MTWTSPKDEAFYELQRLQSVDRKMFESMRMNKRRMIKNKKICEKFDLLCKNIRKNMRIDHKNVRDNFEDDFNLDSQKQLSRLLYEMNYGLDFFVYA